MPAVHAGVPQAVREKFKKRFDKAFDGPVSPDTTRKVAITGRVGDTPTPKTLTVQDQFCFVVMTKAQAKANGLRTCNNDTDLCIWDPVTGRVHCTDDAE